MSSVPINVVNKGVYLNNNFEDSLGSSIESTTNYSRRKRHSRYLITVNTNKRPGVNAIYANLLAEALRDSAERFATDGIEQCIEFNMLGDTWSSLFIESVDFKYVVEVGRHPKGGRVHLHALLDIFHHSNLSLNKQKTRDFFKKVLSDPLYTDLNIQNPYVNVQWKTTDDLIELYFEKTKPFSFNSEIGQTNTFSEIPFEPVFNTDNVNISKGAMNRI